ncbi:hypothetical protein DYBT9275_05102 [Dyadobacter sp. CECT 9275]|uniref:PKD domain-containing protein n=1 Tax=Dyadobacter helix TaxID=2822344 RepID=A0A916NDP3_9BACT|nr:T9SS type B sorting domain-containing protein [Dyadobacter sp. CECT 9275]CAG5012089.1 hypothetical protein DYBT9275_05102 [Dyadobacter sp. CECT 9275]
MKLKLLAFFWMWVWVFISFETNGQGYCGTAGGFSVTPARGCTDLTVSVNNEVSGAQNVRYVYDFPRSQTDPPDARNTTDETSHTYIEPGTYTILQVGSSNGTGFKYCNDVTVFESRPPNVQLLTCGNGKVRLTIVDDKIAQAYDRIEIEWGGGAPINTWRKGDKLYFDHIYPVAGPAPSILVKGVYTDGRCEGKTSTTVVSGPSVIPSLDKIKIKSVEMLADGRARIIYEGMDGVKTEVQVDKGGGFFEDTGQSGTSGGPQSLIVGNLDPRQVYRFMLVSTDICNNMMNSPIVSSISVARGSVALDEIISVEWKSRPHTENLVEYQLKRNGVVIFTGKELSYLDKSVQCGNTYKYEVVAIIENDVRSYSTFVEIEPNSSSPEKIERAVVSVTNDNVIDMQVELSGTGLTSSYNLIVERADLGSRNFAQISPPSNQNLKYTDSQVSTSEQSYCYRFSYQNACKLSSPMSDPVCTILLKSNTVDLSWNADSPFTGGVNAYEVVLRDRNGNVQDEIPKQNQTRHEINLNDQAAGSFSYQVKATGNSANMVSYSNVVSFRRDIILQIPDIFTPNGDTHNDRFEVKVYFAESYRMSIFDRWGSVVFQSTSTADSWDGKVNGKPANGGYYIYKAQVTDATGYTTVKNGSFLLVR